MSKWSVSLVSAAGVVNVPAGGVAATTVQAAINELDVEKAPLASPALTGTPTAPTAPAATNNTQLATTAFVKAALDLLVAAAPSALDTLDELAAALGDDPNFATTVTNAIAAKVSKSGDTMTGLLTVPGIATPSTFGSGTAVTCSSYGTSGGTRFTRISDMAALGVAAFDEANHNPGVSAARRFVIGGAIFDMLHNGNAIAGGAWVDGSDGRVKDEREELADALDKIRRLTGYTFRRVDLPNLDGSFRREAGLIAQDVREVLPEAVIPGDRKVESDPDGEGFLSLNYNGVTALLVEAVKALAARLDDLEGRS